MASCVAPGTNPVGAMMIVTAIIRCYKFDQGKPFHDYWCRFETEPFKFDRAIFSLFGSILHKEGLPIMSL